MKLKALKWRTIGSKLFILYFVSMAVSVMVMGYLSYNKASDIIQSKVGLVALQTVQQVNKRLNTILEDYENRSQLILGYQELQKGMLGEFHDNYERTINMTNITRFISNLVNSKNDTMNLYFLGQRAASFRYSIQNTPTISAIPPYNPPEKPDWYQKILDANGRVVWFGIRESLIKPENPTFDNKPVFSFGRALKNIGGRNEIIGVMVFEVDPEAIESILAQIDFNASGETIIVDQHNRVVADAAGQPAIRYSGIELPGESSGITSTVLDRKKMIVVFDQMEINGWKLVGMAPAHNLVKESREIGLYTLYIASAFMIVAIVFSLLAAKYVQHPVHILLHSMRRAREGKFETQINVRRKDEFGILFDSFNLMVTRIKHLIEELYIQRLLKREIQLKMMASQINAHFIYNTLDSIHWISRIHNVNEISTMIFGLSKYLRISLNEGRDEVTVREAVELIESYLSIIKIRYQEKFTVHMQVDPGLFDYKVLKYVFQPLVENAIYHGLENKKGKGHLMIHWRKKNNILQFSVEDDGIGISQEKMLEIKNALSSNELQGEAHFALKNINSQIRLAYGKDYGLDVESESGAGTQITMRLPLIS